MVHQARSELQFRIALGCVSFQRFSDRSAIITYMQTTGMKEAIRQEFSIIS
jgi:hypothetical protein